MRRRRVAVRSSRCLVAELGRRAQARHELGDNTPRELGPVQEELVEYVLIDPEHVCRLQGRCRGGARRGSEHRELPDGGAWPELDECAIAAMYSNAPVNDRVQMGFDGSFLYERLARRDVFLHCDVGDGSEDPTRYPREQLHPMEGGDALHEPERLRRRCCIRHGRVT